MKIGKLLVVAFWLLSLSAVRAEIIDRLMAVVDGRIITLSDVRRERDLQAALGAAPASEGILLQNLIEQYLIEDQIAQFPGIEVSDSEIDAEFAMLKEPDGVSEQAMRTALRRRIARSHYFDLRFRQFIAATAEEIQRYYDTVFLPAARDRGIATIPPLSDIAASIRANVVDEKLNREVARQLEAIRERSEIEIFQ